MQILHSNGNHWVTVTNIGCRSGTVKTYDSLRMNVRCKAVASIVCTHRSQILVDLPEIQQQVGSNDCGLFAIAFATSILKGEDPSSVGYSHSRIHQHLLSCLEKRHIMVFQGSSSLEKAQSCISVYCSCHLLKSGRMMCSTSGAISQSRSERTNQIVRKAWCTALEAFCRAKGKWFVRQLPQIKFSNAGPNSPVNLVCLDQNHCGGGLVRLDQIHPDPMFSDRCLLHYHHAVLPTLMASGLARYQYCG